MPQNLPMQTAANDSLALIRRNASQTVASSFQLLHRDSSGGQIYNRSNITLDSLSTPFGYQAIASGNRSTALGAFAYGKEDSTVAVGVYAQAFGPSSIAIGDQTLAQVYQSVAIGRLARASGVDSIAIGTKAQAATVDSIAIGNQASVTGDTSIGIGIEVSVTGGESVGIGNYLLVDAADFAVGMGDNAWINTGADYGIAIGHGAYVDDEEGVVVGGDASAYLHGAALGYQALAGEKSVSIGNLAGRNSGSAFARAIAIGYGADADPDSIAIGVDADANSNEMVCGSTTVHIQNAKVVCGANAQAFHVKTSTQLLTINAAASTDTNFSIQDNVIVKAVTVRTTTAIPTAVTYTVTGATTGTTFNTAAVSTAANSTDKGNAAGAYYNATAQFIRITPNAVPANNTGRVRVTLIFEDVTPATS